MWQDEELQWTKKGKMEIKFIWWNDTGIVPLNGSKYLMVFYSFTWFKAFPGWVKSLIRIQKRCHAGLFAALFVIENASDDARKDSFLEQVTSKDAHSIIASYCNQSGAIKCLRICFFQNICGLYIQWNKNLKLECHQFQDILTTASETWWFENIRTRARFFCYQQDFSGLIEEASTQASRYLHHPFQSDDNLSDRPSRFSYLREVVGVFPGYEWWHRGRARLLDVDVELLNREAWWYHTQRQILDFH